MQSYRGRGSALRELQPQRAHDLLALLRADVSFARVARPVGRGGGDLGEDLALGAALQARLKWVRESCDIAFIWKHTVSEISKGYRQRVGLARAVYGDPFLVVLDEPNANLDAEGENALGRAIAILRHNKSIVIVISHRPNALAALDMALVLYEGKAIAFGPSQEVFARVSGSPPPGAAQAAVPNNTSKTPRRAVTAESVSP